MSPGIISERAGVATQQPQLCLLNGKVRPYGKGQNIPLVVVIVVVMVLGILLRLARSA
jgi:hypothetical protein